MSGFDLRAFLANGLIWGGARPSTFDVQGTIPAAIVGNMDSTTMNRLQFTCKAASVPALRLGRIPVGYFGAKIKLAGDREWDDWRITVMNDEDFNGRAFFESWNNSIMAFISNYMQSAEDQVSVSNIAAIVEESYKADWTVTQYGRDKTPIRAYTFIGMWPSIVAEMPLDWDMSNRIQEFGVTMTFDTMYPSLEGQRGNQTLYQDNV
jgi:hypothetical protein